MFGVVILVILCMSVISCSRCVLDDEDVRIVRTTQGAVRGHRDPNTGVFTFHSIPYATVPIKSQRFKGPLPGPTWLHTLDAVDKGIICPQVESSLLDNKIIQEDCLIANVYVPNTTEQQLPVVVYVHGGAYRAGFGDMISPINFVKNKNFIGVTFNYRLGIYGFLCLGTDNVPGNAGLKDQLALLRWVNKNIANFGGNPDNVAISGRSAGSVSVDLLTLSKASRGLFNKVIPESGASIGVIAVQIDPLQNAINFASSFGFSHTDDVYVLEKFFLDSSIVMFPDTQELKNSSYPFVPCVERNSGTDVFLDEAPYNILRSGNYRKMPTLFGFNNMEGIFYIPQFNLWKADMNKKFSDFLPADLSFESEEEKERVAEVVKEFYFSDKPINEVTIVEYVEFFGDVLFIYPMLRSVKLSVEAGHEEIYLYEYSFIDEYVPPIPHTNVRGATHSAQSKHVLDTRDGVNVTEEYNNLRDILQDMWYNFIKSGKPIPEDSSLLQWPAVGKNRSPYMSLGTKVELRSEMTERRALFWDNIYSKYYREPVSPPIPPPNPYRDL